MNLFAHSFFTKLIFGEIEKLEEYCQLPDKDENQHGYSCHFYNPVTEKCFLNTYDSAKNRFIWHLAEYFVTKKDEELGRAIHFLEDMCTPVHTQYEDASDAAIRLNLHLFFEKKFDDFLKDEFEFENFKINSFNDLLIFSPCQAAEFYYLFRDQKKYFESFKKTASLVSSSLVCLKTLMRNNLIIGKSAMFKDLKINSIFFNGEIFGSCLNQNILTKFDGKKLFVFSRENKLFNFNIIGEIY